MFSDSKCQEENYHNLKMPKRKSKTKKKNAKRQRKAHYKLTRFQKRMSTLIKKVSDEDSWIPCAECIATFLHEFSQWNEDEIVDFGEASNPKEIAKRYWAA